MRIKKIGLVLIVLLILVNVWKWWSAAEARLRGQDTPQAKLFSVEDFQVHGLTLESQGKAERDLFRPGKGASDAATNETGLAGKRIAAARAKPVAVAQPVVIPPTPQELAVMASRTQLAQLKCIGVLFQENKPPEAYMLMGDQPYVVRPGDVIGQQFEVEKITLEAVFVIDRQTGVTGTIPVDGRMGSVNK